MVSNLGRIYSFPRYDSMMRKQGDMFLSTKINPNGYEVVILNLNGKRTAKYVHILVAESFLQNPLNKKEVDHIDTDKTNNRLDNLRWCTRRENCENAISYARMVESKKQNPLYGDKNHYSRRVSQYDIDGNFISEFESCGDALRKTGISKGSIQLCASGKRKSAGGYVWKYTSTPKKNQRKPLKFNPKREVCQYDSNGNFIKEYVSITEAAKSVNRSKSSIRQAIINDGKAGGYFWKFKELK